VAYVVKTDVKKENRGNRACLATGLGAEGESGVVLCGNRRCSSLYLFSSDLISSLHWVIFVVTVIHFQVSAGIQFIYCPKHMCRLLAFKPASVHVTLARWQRVIGHFTGTTLSFHGGGGWGLKAFNSVPGSRLFEYHRRLHRRGTHRSPVPEHLQGH